MQIILRQKIYAAAFFAAVILAAACIHSVISYIRTTQLDRTAAAAAERAETSERAARDAERAASSNAARADYLEQQLEEIRTIAKTQDEQLEKLSADTNTARGRADRARGVRAIESTARELCEKLESLGHGCRE